MPGNTIKNTARLATSPAVSLLILSAQVDQAVQVMAGIAGPLKP